MEWKSKFMPSFFKPLISDDFTSQLALPPYFVQRNRDTLPTDAKLQTIYGQTWYVKIEKVGDGKHCFTKGWSEFVKSAKLKLGEFVVFWFDCDNSTFHVSGYGLHGCESELPGCKTRVLSDYESCEDQHVEIHGRVERNAAMTSVFESSSPQLEIVLKEHKRRRVVFYKGFGKHLVGKEFVIMEYTPTQQSKKIVLKDSTRRGNLRLELTFCWSDFCKENGLEFGKSYLFVYKRERNVIQVSPIEKNLQVTVQGKDKMRNVARNLVTRSERNLDPKSSSAKYKRKYVEENVSEEDSDDDSSEDQPVKVHGNHKIRHIAGKSLMWSDRCNLDPESSSARIKRKYIEENVSEDDDDSDDGSSEVKIAEKCRDIKGKVTKERQQTVLDKETSIAYQYAKKSFKSNNPFFVSLMHPSYVLTRFFFAIPGAFVKENLPKECSETDVMLHVPNERTWKVRCLLRSSQANLSGGWMKFVNDNSLKVGDVCVFEVIKKLSWNVIIYRRRRIDMVNNWQNGCLVSYESHFWNMDKYQNLLFYEV